LGYQLKMVMSGSMEPDIQTGSIIAIKLKEQITEYKKGDIVTYVTKENKLITHRIVEVGNEGEFYITKGDRNNAPDTEPVLHQNVIGTYTGFTIPYVGYVVHFLSSQQGILLFIILPGLLLVLYSISLFWRVLKQINGIATKSKIGRASCRERGNGADRAGQGRGRKRQARSVVGRRRC